MEEGATSCAILEHVFNILEHVDVRFEVVIEFLKGEHNYFYKSIVFNNPLKAFLSNKQ